MVDHIDKKIEKNDESAHDPHREQSFRHAFIQNVAAGCFGKRKRLFTAFCSPIEKPVADSGEIMRGEKDKTEGFILQHCNPDGTDDENRTAEGSERSDLFRFFFVDLSRKIEFRQ